MSYERQRNVSDGDWLVDRDHPESVDPTKGNLSHGVGPDNRAIPNHSDHLGHIFTNDQQTINLLEEILKELKKLNVYNAMAHDYEVSDKDIGEI